MFAIPALVTKSATRVLACTSMALAGLALAGLSAVSVAAAAEGADAAAHRALTAEHALRAEPFRALRTEVGGLFKEARVCAAELITKEFGAEPSAISLAACAPGSAPLATMRRSLDSCFARKYRDLDNLIVRLKGTAALAVFRGQGEECGFNARIEAFAAKYDAAEKSLKTVGAEALTFLNQLGECSAEAERLVRVVPVDIENLEVRRAFQQQLELLRKVAEQQASLDMAEPVKAWTDCREALAVSRDLLTRAESLVVPGSRTVAVPRAPGAAAQAAPLKPAPASPTPAPAAPVEAQKAGMNQLMALGDEVSFVATFIRQLGSSELQASELAALQAATGQCEAMPQSLVEEVTEKLGCYANALGKAATDARPYAGASTEIDKTLRRIRTLLPAK